MFCVRFSDCKLSWILRYSGVFSKLTDARSHFSNYSSCQKLSFHNWLCELKYFSFTWSMHLPEENNQLKYQRGFSYSTTVIIKLHYNCNTTILPRRELRTPSYLVFWNFGKYLRKVFETPVNDCVWLSKRGKIYTSYFQGRRKQ